MALHFDYYSDWRRHAITCKCGWHGLVGEAPNEHFHDLMDAQCPLCDSILAVIKYPTVSEELHAHGIIHKPEQQ